MQGSSPATSTHCRPQTPLVELTRWAPRGWRVLLKLESHNKTGSNKDRSCRAMVDDAVARGRLRPGMSVVEASSGNASVAIAAAAARVGCGMTALVPPGMARDKFERQRGFGVEVREVTDDAGRSDPDFRRRAARTMADAQPDRFHTLDQFANPANPRAHETGTGRECVHQLRTLRPEVGELGWFVMGIGTGGTISGVARALKDGGAATDRVRTVAADPVGSRLASELGFGSHDPGVRIPPDGIGAAGLPDNLDRSVVDAAVSITRERALEQVGQLKKLEGHFVGPCTGYALAALLDIIEREEAHPSDQPRTALLLASDRGELYLNDPAVQAAVA